MTSLFLSNCLETKSNRLLIVLIKLCNHHFIPGSWFALQFRRWKCNTYVLIPHNRVLLRA